MHVRLISRGGRYYPDNVALIETITFKDSPKRDRVVSFSHMESINQVCVYNFDVSTKS
jgi:hypothetical protein